MATPPRPTTVPADARFLESDQQWEVGDSDAKGLRTGRWRWWRIDGSLIEDSESLAGELHGAKTWYYEDGNVCFRERNEHGKTLWRCCYRPKGPTREGHPFGGLPEAIHELEQSYSADGWTTSQVLRDANGAEVAFDLTPAPPRPRNIPPDAVFYSRPEMRSRIITATSGSSEVRVSDDTVKPASFYWEVGQWRFVGGEQKWRGVRKAFDGDGRLVRVGYARGEVDTTVGFEGVRGEPAVAAAEAGDTAAVAELLALRAWSGPTAKIHAALLGFADLAAKLDGASAFDITSDEPKRKPAVATSAVWVPSLARFVDVTLDGATPIGTATLWKKYGDVEHWRYVNGVRVFVDRIEHGARVEEELVASGARKGSVHTTRRFSGEVCVSEDVLGDDGTITQRRYDDAGRWRGERRERDGVLQDERWWVGEKLVGTVSRDDDDDDLEVFEGESVRGSTGAGVDGIVCGTWRTTHGEVDLSLIADADFAHVPKATLAHFVEQWARLLEAQVPSVLADVVAVDWEALEGWFGTGPSFAVFLRGLAVDDAHVFEVCLTELRENILHQSTISSAGAPLLTGMLRLVPGLRPAQRIELTEFLCDCWAQCREVFPEMRSVDGTLTTAFVRAHAQLRAAVVEAPDHPQHGYMVKVLADIAENAV